MLNYLEEPRSTRLLTVERGLFIGSRWGRASTTFNLISRAAAAAAARQVKVSRR